MSKMSLSTLTDLLRLGNVIVYSVGYLENQLSSQRIGQQQRLSQIARETGGEAFFPSSKDELTKFYDRIRDDLLYRYTIGYVPAARPARRQVPQARGARDPARPARASRCARGPGIS